MANPFLRGWGFADQMQNTANQRGLGMLSGAINFQNLQAAQEMKPLQIEQLRIAVENAKANQALRNGLLAGGVPMGGTPSGGSGGVGGSGGAIDPRISAMLMSGDPGLVAYARAQLERTKPIATREGGGIYTPGEGWMLTPQPKTQPGVSYNPQTGQAAQVPGYAAAISGIEGATTGAQEDARAQRDLVAVPDGRGGTQMMPRSEALARLGGASAPVAPTQPTTAPSEQAALQQVIEAERAGRPANVAVASQPAPAAPTGPQQPLGTIPTSAVLGAAPSEAAKTVEKKRAEEVAKKEADLPQARLMVKIQTDDFDRLTSIANETMKAPSLARSVGLVGAFPSIPGQPAASIDALINAMKAQISGMKLQSMRAASKTGGAVGQVTEREWPRLENMIVALDKRMDAATFREKLSELVVEINKAKAAVQAAFDEEYGSIGPQRRSTDTANDPLGIRPR